MMVNRTVWGVGEGNGNKKIDSDHSSLFIRVAAEQKFGEGQVTNV